MPSDNILHPAPTLSTLPAEILTFICAQLDRSSAISLSRVARVFTPITDVPIYRELDLFLPPHRSGYSLVVPEAFEETEEYNWAVEEDKKYQEKLGKGLRDKVNGILRRAGERRLGMVEKVVVVPQPGAIHAILSLLDLVSPNLKVLRLEAPRDPPRTQFETCESLDVKLIGYGLSFSSLTHLHITKHSALFAETTLILCQAAPNLVSISAEFAGKTEIPTCVPRPPGHGTELSMPKLLYIKLSFEDRDGELGAHHPLLAIIKGSPAVRQLCLQYWSDDDDLHRELIKLLSEKKELRDLYINSTPYDFLFHSSGGRASGFPSLQRLVLESSEPLDFFEEFIALPCLEILHIQQHDERAPIRPDPTPFTEATTSSLAMLPAFAKGLRDSPRLAIINIVESLDFAGDLFASLDAVEATGDLTGFIRSFVHGDEELLHFRLLSHYEEVGDYPHFDDAHTGPGIYYVAKAGSARKRLFDYQEEAGWSEWAEIDGYKVPVDLIRRMRQVQGADLRQWQGRRNEVDDEAWDVLTKWRDEQNAATSDSK